MRRKMLLSLVLLPLALAGCAGSDGGFGSGGTTNIPDPVYDTGPDEVDSGETAVDTNDTDPGRESGESGGESGGETGDSGFTELSIPGGDSCGYDVGDVACNLIAKDQRGDLYQTWAAYGSPVVVVVGNGYDGQLQSISGWLQDVADSRGAEAVVLLLDAPDLTDAGEADASSWASTYRLDTVLWDEDRSLRSVWSDNSSVKLWLMDENMRIDWINYGYADEVQVEDKIKDL